MHWAFSTWSLLVLAARSLRTIFRESLQTYVIFKNSFFEFSLVHWPWSIETPHKGGRKSIKKRNVDKSSAYGAWSSLPRVKSFHHNVNNQVTKVREDAQTKTWKGAVLFQRRCRHTGWFHRWRNTRLRTGRKDGQKLGDDDGAPEGIDDGSKDGSRRA